MATNDALTSARVLGGASSPGLARALERVRGVLASRAALWVAFAAVHAWMITMSAFVFRVNALWDVDLYRYWMNLGLAHGSWPVFDGDWVYPVGAMLPMLLAAAATTASSVGYALAWCLVVTALNGVAVRTLDRAGLAIGAWWWYAFMLLLGPIAFGRIDAIITPLSVIALAAAIRGRTRLAAVLGTVGAWIKIAPAGLVFALLATARRPFRQVVVPGAAVCLVVLGTVTAAGGGEHVLSFLGAQGGRGLQVEATLGTPWLLISLFTREVTVRYNAEIITYQLSGPGTALAAQALDVVLVLALVTISGLVWRARQRGADVLLLGSLALTTALIAFNKVGSPQFITWLAAPVAVAIGATFADRLEAWRERAALPAAETPLAAVPAGPRVPAEPGVGGALAAVRSVAGWLRAEYDALPGDDTRVWIRLGLLTLVIAGLTQIIFPHIYGQVTADRPGGILVLVLRNVLVGGLLIATMRPLVRAARGR